MGSQLEATIEDVYKKARKELREIIQHKLTVLLGDELELRRQQGEIDRLEDFLKYQQSGDATTYLFNWARHQKVREELHDFRHFRNSIDVQLDARVSGNLSVVIDQDNSQTNLPKPPARNVPSSPLKKQLGMGVPAKTFEKRVQRRTSDFFAETLGSFDQLKVHDDDETDGYSELSNAYKEEY